MQVIAEGVETDMQLAQLHVEDCDIAQGYYFGRPVPATEIGRQLGLYNPSNSVGLHAPRKPPLPLRPAWPEAERRSAQAYPPLEEQATVSEAVN
jgi:predicted signal transduction protein with EAL and GGDEF domain